MGNADLNENPSKRKTVNKIDEVFAEVKSYEGIFLYIPFSTIEFFTFYLP